MSGAIAISIFDLILATGLVIIAAVVSLGLELRLERRLALASVRTVVQLFIIGYVLKWVFGLESFWAILPVATVMIFAAGHAALQRATRRYPFAHWDTFITLFLCSLLTTIIVTRVIISPDPWYKAQYFIPLLGMILGNGLTGISLCIDVLLEQFSEHKDRIEMELAHGATKWEAARDAVREAVRRGMIPIINSMSVVGLVSLPGMMTGQILAGEDPAQAVRYQIIVMFMIAAATSLGCIGTAMLAYKRLFNHRHQLRAELIVKR